MIKLDEIKVNRKILFGSIKERIYRMTTLGRSEICACAVTAPKPSEELKTSDSSLVRFKEKLNSGFSVSQPERYVPE